MQPIAEPVARLIDEFAKLPGIRPKTAQRLILPSTLFKRKRTLWPRRYSDEREGGSLLYLLQYLESETCPVCAKQGTERSFVSSKSRWMCWRWSALVSIKVSIMCSTDRSLQSMSWTEKAAHHRAIG